MNPKLEEAEKQLRQEEQDQTLAETRDADRGVIDGVAFSGFNIPVDIVYALCRECERLRREVEALKQKVASAKRDHSAT